MQALAALTIALALFFGLLVFFGVQFPDRPAGRK